MTAKLQIKIPKAAMSITPFFLSAPSSRCGTTLLQRVLCSADNAICFGELLGKQLHQTARQLQAHVLDLGGRKDYFNGRLAQVLQGQTDQWIPDLIPPVDAYLQAQTQAFYMVPLYYQQFAESAGRRVWGCKTPSWSAREITDLRTYFPHAKVIYIYRPLADCLRSARARDFVTTSDEAKRFCADWAANMRSVAGLIAKDWFLAVDYDAMVKDPKNWIAQLEQTTGARGIDPGVFSVKVNTWQGQSADQYVPPAPLSPADAKLVEDTAYVVDLPDRAQTNGPPPRAAAV